jgi:hypothetical protein
MEQSRVLLVGQGSHFPQPCIQLIKGYSKKIDLCCNWRDILQNTKKHKGEYILACIDDVFHDTPKVPEVLVIVNKVIPVSFENYYDQSCINVLQHVVPFIQEQKIPFLVRLNFKIKDLQTIKKENLGASCKGVFTHHDFEEFKTEISRSLAA